MPFLLNNGCHPMSIICSRPVVVLVVIFAVHVQAVGVFVADSTAELVLFGSDAIIRIVGIRARGTPSRLDVPGNSRRSICKKAAMRRGKHRRSCVDTFLCFENSIAGIEVAYGMHVAVIYFEYSFNWRLRAFGL